MITKQGIGIDIALNAVRGVKLKQARGQVVVMEACAIETEEEPLFATAGSVLLQRLRKALRVARVIGQKGLSAIPGRDGVFQYFYIPGSVQKNLKPLIRIITATASLEEIRTGWMPIHPSQAVSENQLYMVALCKNDVLEKGRSLLEKGGLRSRRFALRSTGLHALAQHLRIGRGQEAILVAELDRKEVNMVILIGSELAYARAFSYSKGGFTERLKQRFSEDKAYMAQVKSQVNLFTPNEAGDAQLFHEIAQGLAADLRQSIQAAQIQLKLKDLRIERFHLCGGESGIAGLAQYLAEILEKPVHVIDPFDGMVVPSQKKGREISDKQSLAVAVGLALSDLASDKKQPISLTPRTVEERDYFWSHTAYRYYAIGIALLTALFVYLGSAYSLNVVDQVNREVDQQLQQIKGKKEQLLGVTVGLGEVEKQWMRLTEYLYRPEPALDILEEIGRVTPSEIGIGSIEIKNAGPGFPFDQEQVITLTGFLHDSKTTEVAFLEKIERYARTLEQSPRFVQRKIHRLGEPTPIQQMERLAANHEPAKFQFQFQLAPGK